MESSSSSKSSDSETKPKVGELPGNTVGSMIGAVALGLIISVIGAFFCFALWIGYQKAELSRGWDEVPCEITNSWVETRPPKSSPSYLFRIEYKYTYKDKDFVGTKRKRVDGASSVKSKAFELMADYPEGMRTVCYVNPKDPTFAILVHDSKAALYTIWFPGLFVIAGIGIAITGIRGWRRRKAVLSKGET